MDGGAGYGGLQQPPGAYGDAGAGDASANYSSSQNPTSPYNQAAPGAASFSSGLGNGVNLQPSYYNGGAAGNPLGNVDLGWDSMRKYRYIKSVRIEIELGQEVNAQRWIKEALANDYSVIATFHKAAILQNAVQLDDPNELLTAAAWWAAYYPQFSQSGDVVINLMNEWGSSGISPHAFAVAYNQAIAKVREVYSGLIVVDIPGWGHEAQTARQAVIEIADRNIALSAHIYPEAWNTVMNRGMTRADIDELASAGLECIVGEFGDSGLTPNTPWKDLVTYAKSKGWKVFGWAWCGDGGVMNMILPNNWLPYAPPPATPPTYTVDSTYVSKIDPLLAP